MAGAELGMVSKGLSFNPEQGQCFGQLMQKLSEAVVLGNLWLNSASLYEI